MAGESNPVRHAEVTHKVQSVPQHRLHRRQVPYRTLILDYDRETPQCHADNSAIFPLYEPVSF